MKENLCDSCQGMLCGCKAKEDDKVYSDEGKVIFCKMYMRRVRPGHCINCESGGNPG